MKNPNIKILGVNGNIYKQPTMTSCNRLAKLITQHEGCFRFHYNELTRVMLVFTNDAYSPETFIKTCEKIDWITK